MSLRLAYPASQSTAFLDQDRQQILQHRPVPGGLAARAQSSVQARGPAAGTRAAADAAGVLRLFDGAPPQCIAIDPYASVASARDDDAAARSGRLDNRGATFPAGMREGQEKEPVPQKGASRWRLKAKVVKLLRPEDGGKGPAVCGCGMPGLEHGAEPGERRERDTVTIHRRASGAGVSGVFRCDSPWLCPSCAPARAKRRRERLEQVIEATARLGGSCAFVTLTLRHDHHLPLAQARAILSEASRRARQGSRWKGIKGIQASGGLLGVVQGVEVLHSLRTGWHYHAHLLIPGTGTPAAVLDAARRLVARYLEEVARLGASATLLGQDVQLVQDGEAARYASKGSASWEVAGGAKEARSAVSRSPWDLATLAALGDERARALFLEYSKAMPRTRSCVVSAGLAKALGIEACEDEDEPDEEQQLDEADGVVGELPSLTWRRILGAGVAWRVLAAVEAREDWPKVASLAEKLGSQVEARRRAVEEARTEQASRAAEWHACRHAAFREHLIHEAAGRVSRDASAGTRSRIRRVIDAVAAANPDLAPPTETEVIQALPKAA